MTHKVIGKCPICGSNLYVSELSCESCDTKITGKYSLSRFDYLTKEQLEFALVFIKNSGNIKLIEKELNISYPTVKKNLTECIEALGFDVVNIKEGEKLSKEDIYEALRNKEINLEEAERLLKEVCDE